MANKQNCMKIEFHTDSAVLSTTTYDPSWTSYKLTSFLEVSLHVTPPGLLTSDVT